MPKSKDNWQYEIFGPKKFWTQFALPARLFLEKIKPNVFFTPSHYAPRISPVPTAIAIMDVSYLHFPAYFDKSDLYQLRHWTSYSAKHAKRIFTISSASKRDIIAEYHIAPDQVIITYPGIKNALKSMERIFSTEELKKKFGVLGSYVLFVGTLQPRKNIARLIEAFAKVAQRKKDVELVIIGKKGWLYEAILDAPQKFGISHKVKFLDFVTDEDLPSFYKHAICFILPSLYEGFGLPVLEAMSYGCPVITSNISSLPEAGGDAAAYVNPTDSNEIAAKILELIENEKVRKNMIKKGYEQIKKFSWEKTAGETLKVLEEIAKK